VIEKLSVRKKLCAAYMSFAGATVFGACGVVAAIDRPGSISTIENCNYTTQSTRQPEICDAVRERFREQHIDDQLALECMAVCGILTAAGFLAQDNHNKAQQLLDTSGMENEYRLLTGYSGLAEA
jgi:hypothetical protein